MAWDQSTLRQLVTDDRNPVDERFADLLRKVAAGEMSKDDAWATWDLIRGNNCASCDGYGGLAFVGSVGAGIPCGRCNGTGKV